MSPRTSRSDPEARPDGGYVLAYPIADDERPAEAILRCIAAYTDQETRAMTPLYEHIDVESVNALFDRPSEATPDSIVFWFEGNEIEVTNDSVYIRHTGADPDVEPR